MFINLLKVDDVVVVWSKLRTQPAATHAVMLSDGAVQRSGFDDHVPAWDQDAEVERPPTSAPPMLREGASGEGSTRPPAGTIITSTHDSVKKNRKWGENNG